MQLSPWCGCGNVSSKLNNEGFLGDRVFRKQNRLIINKNFKHLHDVTFI